MPEPIDVDFLKQHCRITGNLEDSLLAVYIPAARQLAEAWCNTQFVSQLVQKTYTIAQMCEIPAADVVGVTGFYTSVAELPISGKWFTEYVKGISVSREYPIYWDELPTYTVQYQVTVNPVDVPDAVRVAIAKIAASLYEERENSGTSELGITAKTLLAAYRSI
ncbi:head-tail connector protein [Hymenobacter sp. M29]|uniref:Head-tail connector protein n=1 Tax=Hymenobacter mellowenesis TaxID=3063995 RepID=A0ABT9ADL2_9BACT|nr:head-tail connector protein [Hymenobacter sp. M29]MDO7847459.1 head-tail connector protein [Hymenobacter sp. M29]